MESWYCNYCGKALFSRQAWNSHLQSKQHLLFISVFQKSTNSSIKCVSNNNNIIDNNVDYMNDRTDNNNDYINDRINNNNDIPIDDNKVINDNDEHNDDNNNRIDDKDNYIDDSNNFVDDNDDFIDDNNNNHDNIDISDNCIDDSDVKIYRVNCFDFFSKPKNKIINDDINIDNSSEDDIDIGNFSENEMQYNYNDDSDSDNNNIQNDPMQVKFISKIQDLINLQEQLFIELKVSQTLSNKTMNVIIACMKKVDFSDLLNSYEEIEKNLINVVPLQFTDTSSITKKIVTTDDDEVQTQKINTKKIIPYISIIDWFYLLLHFTDYTTNLITTVSSVHTNIIEDMTSGKWFQEFLTRVPEQRLPIALGIFYDHWKVSPHVKIGGLYFTILNTNHTTYLKPDKKFVLALVPENVNIQAILQLTLGCLKQASNCFDIQLVDKTFKLYIEIAELLGDTPGLAELSCVISHNGKSPCRKCYKLKENLFDFTPSEEKTQRHQKFILQQELPNLQVHGKIGTTKENLKNEGLKSQMPFFFEFNHFNHCRQSLTCLMHNEELGLFRLELKLYFLHIGVKSTKLLFNRMIKMPKIPGIPSVYIRFLDKLDSLLAKEIIAIAKRIIFCIYDLCSECKDS